MQRMIYPFNWSLVRCRSSTGREIRRPKTDILPLCYITSLVIVIVFVVDVTAFSCVVVVGAVVIVSK